MNLQGVIVIVTMLCRNPLSSDIQSAPHLRNIALGVEFWAFWVSVFNFNQPLKPWAPTMGP